MIKLEVLQAAPDNSSLRVWELEQCIVWGVGEGFTQRRFLHFISIKFSYNHSLCHDEAWKHKQNISTLLCDRLWLKAAIKICVCKCYKSEWNGSSRACVYWILIIYLAVCVCLCVCSMCGVSLCQAQRRFCLLRIFTEKFMKFCKSTNTIHHSKGFCMDIHPCLNLTHSYLHNHIRFESNVFSSLTWAFGCHLLRLFGSSEKDWVTGGAAASHADALNVNDVLSILIQIPQCTGARGGVHLLDEPQHAYILLLQTSEEQKSKKARRLDVIWYFIDPCREILFSLATLQRRSHR